MKEILVPENKNIVINDTRIPYEVVSDEFYRSQTSIVSFEIMSAIEMTAELEKQISIALLGISNFAAILYPGEGAISLLDFFSDEIRTQIGIRQTYRVSSPAQYENNRRVYSEIEIDETLIEKIKTKEVTDLIIVDDVVVTGGTIQTIKESVEGLAAEYDDSEYDPTQRFSFPKLVSPAITWRVWCWLVEERANTKNFFTKAYASYRKKNGRSPLNSLSTLLADSPKGDSVRYYYSNKFWKEPEEFLEIINRLKKLL
jgi:hypoxanthine phosphoribosyltransferase